MGFHWTCEVTGVEHREPTPDNGEQNAEKNEPKRSKAHWDWKGQVWSTVPLWGSLSHWLPCRASPNNHQADLSLPRGSGSPAVFDPETSHHCFYQLLFLCCPHGMLSVLLLLHHRTPANQSMAMIHNAVKWFTHVIREVQGHTVPPSGREWVSFVISQICSISGKLFAHIWSGGQENGSVTCYHVQSLRPWFIQILPFNGTSHIQHQKLIFAFSKSEGIVGKYDFLWSLKYWQGSTLRPVQSQMQPTWLLL